MMFWKWIKVFLTIVLSLTIASAHVDLRQELDLARQELHLQTKHVAYDLQGSGCQCVMQRYDCGCCVHLDIPQINLNDTGCVNITYLPVDIGISLIFSINDRVLINATMSARNPPPLCVGVPYLKKAASLCLDFYDMQISRQQFSGCIKLEAELLHVVVEHVKIGCFRIPLAKKLGVRESVNPRTTERLLRMVKNVEEERKRKRDQRLIIF